MKRSFIGAMLLTVILSIQSWAILLGVDKKPKWYSDNQIIDQSKKHQIQSEYSVTLDTIRYKAKLRELYAEIFQQLRNSNVDSSEYKKQKGIFKDDSQPVQFRLFDTKGNEVFKIVNCYVDKPITADWNVNGCFDSFPPYINEPNLNIHNYNLEFLLACTNPLNDSKPLTREMLPSADYYGVIIWNDVYHKYSKNLIKIVQKRISSVNKSVVLIYVNNHNAAIWSLTDTETKQKIKEELKAK
ncbi:MAG: hypothetical protein H3C31_04290 [Brumimicrobium sp.]|nr:hypothetical protein [Brumimicrobium sp.]